MYGQSIHHQAIWDRHPRQVMALMEHPEAVCAIYQHYVSGYEFEFLITLCAKYDVHLCHKDMIIIKKQK